ncbi:MAG TPA: hypothetical protein VLF90_00490 [Patescibacteria group bacterium]|nr:hypothetical protein [Patescibacteria group bacterium]
MGATWVRSDGRAGEIDLGALASADNEYHIEAVNLVSELGVDYTLTALEETSYQHGVISPIHLRALGLRSPDDSLDALLLAPATVYHGVRNWIVESRRFPKDASVNVNSEAIVLGKPITINGIKTKPIVRGWVRERGTWLPNF